MIGDKVDNVRRDPRRAALRGQPVGQPARTSIERGGRPRPAAGAAATSTAARSRPRWWPTSWASTASTSARSAAGTPAPGVVFRTHTVPDGPAGGRVTDDRFRQVATQRALARGHRAALRRPRARLPRRRARRAARARRARRPRAARPRADYLSLMATVASRARALAAPRSLTAHGAAGVVAVRRAG